MSRIKVIIMGAAGRDFHNFNTVFRDNDAYEVVAFTATQIPNIDGRRYPPELAGKLYPAGIPIYPEADLDRSDQRAQRRSGHLRLFGRAARIRDAQSVASAGRRVRLPPDRPEGNPDQIDEARRLDLRGAHRRGQEPDHAARVGNPEGHGLQGRSDSPPHALRQSGEANRAALCRLQRSGQARVHDRRTRRIRAAHRSRRGDLRGRRLRSDSAPGRAGSGHHSVGRRQQRHLVLPERSAHRRGRSASPRP